MSRKGSELVHNRAAHTDVGCVSMWSVALRVLVVLNVLAVVISAINSHDIHA
jgi:hypothetical protein